MADRSEESLSSSLAAEFISNPGEQTQKQHWHDRPHGELVDSVKQAIASARADSEAKGHNFDPIKWVSLELTRTIGRASGDAMQKRLDASLAWDAISLPFILDKEYQQAVGSTLLSGTALRRSNIVTLNRESRTLINVMADAVAVPHDPRQTAVDLLPNNTAKTLFREMHTRIARETGI